MQDELTAIEKKHIVYAGKFIIYMQALLFLSDYLNNDIYYGAKYDLHNFNRAANQLKLLKALLEKEEELDNRWLHLQVLHNYHFSFCITTYTASPFYFSNRSIYSEIYSLESLCWSLKNNLVSWPVLKQVYFSLISFSAFNWLQRWIPDNMPCFVDEHFRFAPLLRCISCARSAF